MADELQALLDRIHEEGVKKAESEAARILDEARAKAGALVEAAREESRRALEAAQRDSAALVSKGEETLRQAARDVLLSLREQLQDRLRDVAKACVAREVSGQSLAALVGAGIERLASAEDGGDIHVLVAEKDREAVSQCLMARLGEDLRARTYLSPLPGMEGGFKLRFEASSVMYDFSDEALADALSALVSPRLAELIKAS